MGTALFAAPLPAEERPPSSASDARTELLARWERSRVVDVAYREVTTRQSGGRTTTEAVLVAQRPPDRVVTGGSSVSGVVGGRAVGCVVATDAPARCHDAGPADANDMIDGELDRLRDATGGWQPAYRVSDLGGGCLRLRLVRETTRPTFGRRLDVCFDERTGVARREVSVVGDVTATTVRTDARPSHDDDFVLPAPIS